MGILDMFSTGPAQQAAADQTAAIQQGMDALNKQFGLGRGALTTDYAKALAPYTTNFNVANQGQNAYADYMGLNGPEGSARAVAAFQANPGYQFQLQQGLNSVMANQARTGQLASGNTDIALQQMGQNIANQGWGNFGSMLQPFLNAAGNAATGIAGVDTGLGNAINQNYTGLGQGLAQGYGAIGNAQANAALAPYQIGANIAGMLGGAAKLGTSLFGGFGKSA